MSSRPVWPSKAVQRSPAVAPAEGRSTGSTSALRLGAIRLPQALWAATIGGAEAQPLASSAVESRIEALIGARRFADALRFVELQLQNYPQDIRLHKMRAESYAGLGRRSQQHQAQAEVLALQGQTEPAIQQLVLAQGAADGNFYEMSVIDTRLRELRRRLMEEQRERRGK